MVAADFNRDGVLDLAHANLGGDTVSILLGTRGGLPAFSQAVPVGAGPFDLTVGDFNRDGIEDLAVANADSHSITILVGRRDGRFTRSADLDTGAALSPRGIAAADLNGDGRVDLVYTTYVGGTVQTLLGNGSGGFTAGARLTGYAAQPQGVAIGDFDRDGHPDLAVAYDSAGGLAILDGGRAALVARRIRGASDLTGVVAADLNRDGWTDVVAVSTRRSKVSIYMGTASGLQYRASYAVATGPRGVAVGDTNGDGLLDIITASRETSAVSVLLGVIAHAGTFLPALEFPAGQGSRAVVAADVDADGRLDLATGNQYAGAVSILINETVLARAGFSFGEMAVPVAASLVSGSPLSTADFNGDGRLDIVARGGSGPYDSEGLVVILTGEPPVLLPGLRAFAGFLVGDFNADGHADVIYLADADPSPGVHTALLTFLGDGRGAFAAAAITGSTAWLRDCAAGDLTRDGRSDLVCIGSSDAGAQIVQVLAGAGNGTFSRISETVLTNGASDVEIADVNRDGKPDVVLLQAVAEIWLGDGAGGLSRGATVGLGSINYPLHLRVADLNHDARLDLIVSGNDGEVVVSAGGASGFVAGEVLGAIAFGSDFDIADFDQDGHADIVGHSGVVLRGNGDGTFKGSEAFAVAGGVGLGDITGDGLPDIVTEGLGGLRVLTSRRSSVNHRPVIVASDRTLEYHQLIPDPITPNDCAFLSAEASDPDQHAVTFEWRDSAGAVASTEHRMFFCTTTAGTYTGRLTVRDGRGGATTRTLTLTIRPGKEVVVYAVAVTSDDDVWLTGEWTQVADATGVGGYRAFAPDRRAAKSSAPDANPASAIRIRFTPDPTQTYKLWLRLKAQGNSYSNDSVWVQFSGATDAAGTPVYRIGTTSGLAVNLEECSGCGVSAWGWEDDGWGAVDRNGVRLRFPAGGRQDILIQVREDGVSIDQVVLSAEKYLTARPGAAKNDHTLLPRTYQVNPH